MGNIIIQNVNRSTINIGGSDATDNANAIKSLIAQGSTMAALERFASNDNDVILLKSRLNRITKEKMRGTVSLENFNLEISQINRSVLEKIGAYDCSVVDNVAGIDKTISAPLIDPQELETIITTQYGGYLAEYPKVISFGIGLLEYLKGRCSHRIFDLHFQDLRYAIQDLNDANNIQNLKAVIEAISQKRTLILEFLANDAKETTLEALYNAAKSDNSNYFFKKYEDFLNKYFSLKSVPNKDQILSMWQDEKQRQVSLTGSDAFVTSEFDSLKAKWLTMYKP